MKLRVKDLNFRYQNPEILKNVNLELAPGSIMALIGPNGSGKSTLLRCINRILQPDSGIVYLDQISIESMKRKEIARAVGYVPQTKQVTSRITVFETVLMGRKPHISWKAGDKDLKLVSAIISDLGLEQLAHRHLDQLSGGQIQKVSLARALAQEPQILLLDEPTSNLDLKHQLEIINLIKKQAGQGVGIVVTVHDLSLAGRFSDRIVMLKEGEIFACGGREILTADNIEAVYGVKVTINRHRDQIIVIPEEPINH